MEIIIIDIGQIIQQIRHHFQIIIVVVNNYSSKYLVNNYNVGASKSMGGGIIKSKNKPPHQIRE